MRLRKPCEHGRYDPHTYSLPHGDGRTWWAPLNCPGGEFLADDALVVGDRIEAEQIIVQEVAGYHMTVGDAVEAAGRILDALTVREDAR